MPDPRAAFELSGDRRGVLLVHGFTASPFDLRPLGEHLHGRGMTVRAVRLPGHGTTPEELDRTPWTDWYAEVERGLAGLRDRCDRVAVVGQSLGGLLALHLAADHGDELAAVCSLAAPMWLEPAARAVIAAVRRVPALADVLGPLPKRDGPDVADRVMKEQIPTYPVIPLRALVEVDRARVTVRAELARVRQPLLLVHALHDHVAPYGSMALIAGAVASRVVETVTLPRSFHIVSLDVERERVADAVGSFLARHLR